MYAHRLYFPPTFVIIAVKDPDSFTFLKDGHVILLCKLDMTGPGNPIL